MPLREEYSLIKLNTVYLLFATQSFTENFSLLAGTIIDYADQRDIAS